jgi:hypothetical protein
MPVINLPLEGGRTEAFRTGAPREFPRAAPPFPRVALAAAHVVADPLAPHDPWTEASIDWDRTIAFRRHLWSLGLGVAEAMDTAQRGMGLDWAAAQELIRRSLDAMRDFPGAAMASGAGTDHLAPGPDVTVDDVVRAYEEQCEAVERMGGRIILMASRALAHAARGPADYERVYARILGGVRRAVIIHWLGEMFDPALEGYWGAGRALQGRMRPALACHRLALGQGGLGEASAFSTRKKEIALRRRLPADGSDVQPATTSTYCRADRGACRGASNALLGIIDPIAPAVGGCAGGASAGGRPRRASTDILGRRPVPLSRHIFRGADALLQDRRGLHAWLPGTRDHFTMLAASNRRAASAISPSFSAWPTGRLLRTRTWRGADAGAAAVHGRHEPLPNPGPLASTPVTVRDRWACRMHRGLRAARHPRHLPWRDVLRNGRGEARRGASAMRGCVSGLCRGGCSPPPMRPAAAAHRGNRRASARRRALRRCLVWSAAACPGLEGPARRARGCCTTGCTILMASAGGGRHPSRSSRCIR